MENAKGDDVKEKKRILLVEDSPDISMLLGQLLESEGYTLFYADNGVAALKQATINRPQLILMDLSLPSMDGWEATRRLRLMPEFASTPIIALTANATKYDEDRAIEAGCTGYISKPFNIDPILDYIASLLETA